jgi:hypothetical protein
MPVVGGMTLAVSGAMRVVGAMRMVEAMRVVGAMRVALISAAGAGTGRRLPGW